MQNALRQRFLEFKKLTIHKHEDVLKLTLKRKTRIKRFLKSIRIFLIGTKMQVNKKPELSTNECFAILLNLHVNIRFICHIVDLQIDVSAAMWVIHILEHMIVCPCFALLFTFFGRYGARSFLTLWDIVPLFRGLAPALFIYECYKMVVTSNIITSALLLLLTGQYTHKAMYPDLHNASWTPTSGPEIPVMHTPYGIGDYYNGIGYDKSIYRMFITVALWLLILVICMQKKNGFRKRITQIAPGLLLLTLGGLLADYLFKNRIEDDPELKSSVANVDSYKNVKAYTYVFFPVVIGDYLPTHWVTIGYLAKASSLKTEILTISIVLNLLIALFGWTVKFHSSVFDNLAIKVLKSEELNEYGPGYFFVTIPYMIYDRIGNYGPIIIKTYILILVFSSIAYIVTNMQMLYWALHTQKCLFRYRRSIEILLCLVLFGGALLGCFGNTHYQIYYAECISIGYATFVFYLLTVLGIGIYSLELINGDHQFLYGSEYPYSDWIKIVFMFTLPMTLFAALEFYKQKSFAEFILPYYFALFPFLCFIIILGMLVTCWQQLANMRVGREHRIFSPSPTWGRPSEELRIMRRERNIRQMFIYRTKRQCKHICMMNHEQLKTEIQDELAMRKVLLSEYIFHEASSSEEEIQTTTISDKDSDVPEDEEPEEDIELLEFLATKVKRID